MIFIEWRSLGVWSGVFLFIAVGMLGFWLVRRKRPLVRVPVQLFFSLVIVSGLSILAVMVFFPDPNSYSVPVYSPSGKMAARVNSYNAGGFGGAETSVELFSAHGLKSERVFFGEYNAVDGKALRWISDSELDIPFRSNDFVCRSTAQVKVQCVRVEAEVKQSN